MPKPLFGDNGNGMHCRHSIWKEGAPLFYNEVGYAGLSDISRYYIGGLLAHAPSLLAFTNPTANSYHRLVPGFEHRQPGLLAAQPFGLRPDPDHRHEPQGQARRVPRSRPVLQPLPRVRRDADGGPGRHQDKIEPPEPVDKDLYELPPDKAAAIHGPRLPR